MSKIKISIIIPTYNRFNYLLNAVQSVQNQSYKNIEIIIVNDHSTQSEYYQPHDLLKDCTLIHLTKNSKQMFGFACAAYVRTVGIKQSTGDYVAFLDDDDYWFPHKLELQLSMMKTHNCNMSSTEALIGYGIYDQTKQYPKYVEEKFWKQFSRAFNIKSFKNLPIIWNRSLLLKGNSCICSSILVDKKLLEKVDYMPYKKPPGEDYQCWLNLLQHTNCAFVKEPCLYYDFGHGDGQNY